MTTPNRRRRIRLWNSILGIIRRHGDCLATILRVSDSALSSVSHHFTGSSLPLGSAPVHERYESGRQLIRPLGLAFLGLVRERISKCKRESIEQSGESLGPITLTGVGRSDKSDSGLDFVMIVNFSTSLDSRVNGKY